MSKQLPADFPKTPEEWERIIANAPETVDDPDCPYDPNDAQAVEAYWKDAIVSRSLPELLEKLAVRRRGQGKKPARIAIQLRLPPDVLARWKADGPGWQTRMANRLAMPVE